MPLVPALESAAPIWLRATQDDTEERRTLERTVTTARQLANARRVSLLLPSPDSATLVVAAASGMDSRLAARVRVQLGEPVAGIVALNRQPVLANECELQPNQRSRGYHTGAFISVPVPLGNDACGVLNVSDPRRPEGYESRDVQALENLVQRAIPDLRFQHATRRVGVLEDAVQRLRRQVIEVQEAERQRIARDLHDEAGHALTSAVLSLDLEMMHLAESATVEAMQRVRQQLVECSGKLHAIAFDLRPRILEDLGLHAALRSVASQVMDSTDLDVMIMVEGTAWKLGQIEELVVLRIVQEALTNVRKHAQASRVKIVLDYEVDGLMLQIVDDGIGVRPRTGTPCPVEGRISLGIDGMRERIEQVGGSFSIRRGCAGGTLITAKLPVGSYEEG
jgi:signal transduction histidine kinase